MTPARIAVATALTQTSSSEPSSTPPPSHRPTIRQASLGRKPAISSTSSACRSPTKSARRSPIGALPPPVNGIGDGAGRYTADQDIDTGVQCGRERKQCQSQHQRQDIGKLPAVACGGEQKRQRRQQQDRGGKQLREVGCEAVADRGRNEADCAKTDAEAVGERDSALARH